MLYSQKCAPRAYRNVMHILETSNFVHEGAVSLADQCLVDLVLHL